MHCLTNRKIVLESSTALWVMDYSTRELLDTVGSSIGSVHLDALWTLLVSVMEADAPVCVRTHAVKDTAWHRHRHCSNRQARQNQGVGLDQAEMPGDWEMDLARAKTK